MEQGDTPQVEGGRDNTKTKVSLNLLRIPSPGCKQSQLVLGEEYLHSDHNRRTSAAQAEVSMLAGSTSAEIVPRCTVVE